MDDIEDASNSVKEELVHVPNDSGTSTPGSAIPSVICSMCDDSSKACHVLVMVVWCNGCKACHVHTYLHAPCYGYL